MTRRALAAFLLASPLAGCGFHPLYGPPVEAASPLQAIFVDIIPERDGQLLRQSLQFRLEGSDGSATKRYILAVRASAHEETLGIQPDNSNTRNRRVAEANWTLTTAAPPARPIASGHARSVDGYNIIDEQFFYSDLADEQAQRRQADALAEAITQQIATWFRTHPNAA
jgi:LPS-assembly lipoprotein